MVANSDVVVVPPNEVPADELWVWLSVDAKGNEGIVALLEPPPALTLVTANPRIVPMMTSLAERAAAQSGQRLRLVRFTRANVVQEIFGGN